MADTLMNRAQALEVAAETHGKKQELRALPTGFGGILTSEPVSVSVPNDPAEVVAAAEAYVKFLEADDVVDAHICEVDEDGVRYWIDERGANAERVARLLVSNHGEELIDAVAGEWGLLGALRALTDRLDPRSREDLLRLAFTTDPADDGEQVAVPDDDRDAVTVMAMQRKGERLHAATIGDLWRTADEELALHLPTLATSQRRSIAANIALRFQRDSEPF